MKVPAITRVYINTDLALQQRKLHEAPPWETHLLQQVELCELHRKSWNEQIIFFYDFNEPAITVKQSKSVSA